MLTLLNWRKVYQVYHLCGKPLLKMIHSRSKYSALIKFLIATWFSHKLPLYVSPVLDIQAFAIYALSMNWNNPHVYEFPPTVLIPPKLTFIRQSRCNSNCSTLALTFLILWGVTTTSISLDSTAILSKFTDTSNGKVSTSEPPNFSKTKEFSDLCAKRRGLPWLSWLSNNM